MCTFTGHEGYFGHTLHTLSREAWVTAVPQLQRKLSDFVGHTLSRSSPPPAPSTSSPLSSPPSGTRRLVSESSSVLTNAEMSAPRELIMRHAADVDSADVDSDLEERVHVRTRQLLGLPPVSNHRFVVEMWVRTEDLFRPCRDAEITDEVRCSTYCLPFFHPTPTPTPPTPPLHQCRTCTGK